MSSPAVTPSLSQWFLSSKVSMPRVSPNGKLITYVREEPERNQIAIAIQSLQESMPHETALTAVNTRIGWLGWAYDHIHLLYLCDKDGSEEWQLYAYNTQLKQHHILSPSGGYVESVHISKGLPEGVLFTCNARQKTYHDLYATDLNTMKTHITHRNEGKEKKWYFNKQHCAQARTIVQSNGAISLEVRNPQSHTSISRGPWRTLLTWEHDDVYNSGVLSFSDDGLTLYIIDSRKRDTGALRAVDVMTGKLRTLKVDNTYDLSPIPPNLFDLLGIMHPKSHFLFDEAGHISAICYATQKHVWVFLSSSIGPNLKKVLSDTERRFWIEDQESREFLILGCESSDRAASSYYLYNRNIDTLTPYKPVTNQSTESPWTQPARTPIRFQARDGAPIEGYLTLTNQENTSVHAPLVVKIHGGPWARDLWSYNAEAAFLTSRGYHCLEINYRSSSGYGKKHMNDADGSWGTLIVHDIEDGVAWACSQNIAHRNAVFLMGRSFGGFLALATATQPGSSYAGVIAHVPVTDLVSLEQDWPPRLYLSLPQIERRRGNAEESLKKNSPLYRIKHLSSPLLLSYTTADWRAPSVQCKRLRTALDAARIPYQALVFSGEGHRLLRAKNVLLHYRTIEAFLEQHRPRNFHREKLSTNLSSMHTSNS